MKGASLFNLQRIFDWVADSQSKCVRQLVKGDYEEAKKTSLLIFDSHPGYLILVLKMGLPTTKKLLLLVLKKTGISDPHFLLSLINDDRFTLDELEPFVLQTEQKDDFIHLLIQRDWLIRSNKADQKALDSLLEKLDDYKLYSYAAEHNIAIAPRNTVNYFWYLATHHKNKKVAAELVMRSSDFSDILKLCQNAEICSVGEPSYDILIDFLLNGFSENMLDQILPIFKASKSFLNYKIVLALLIASRKEENLVCALHLSSIADFSDNYEIQLINLFLNRYFCLVPEVLCGMAELKIKNIQERGNAFIWSDPMILCGEPVSQRITRIKDVLRSEERIAEQKVGLFIKANRIELAADMLKLLKSLKDPLCLKEIIKMQFAATSPTNTYSELLGKPCEYLFNKLVAGHERKEASVLGSLYTFSNGKSIDELLVSKFGKIEDTAFIKKLSEISENAKKHNREF